jgi:hypothetical protein
MIYRQHLPSDLSLFIVIYHENSESRTKDEQYTKEETRVEGESTCKPADAATNRACLLRLVLFLISSIVSKRNSQLGGAKKEKTFKKERFFQDFFAKNDDFFFKVHARNIAYTCTHI